MVKLYGFEDCPYCQELKGLFDTNGIEYTYVDVMADENEKEIEKILEQRTKLIEKLTSISFIENIYQTDANFVLVKVDDAVKRYNQLIEKGTYPEKLW